MTEKRIPSRDASGVLDLYRRPAWQRYAMATLACVATALIATPLLAHLDPANIVMLFLLTVLLVAVAFGLASGLLAAFLSVGLFDFFFVPPRFTLAVQDAQYLVTFAVMLAVAAISARLAAGLRRQAEASAANERQAQALAEMARELSGALTLEQVASITATFLRRLADTHGLIFIADDAGRLSPVVASGVPGLAVEAHLASIAFTQGRVVGGAVECAPPGGHPYAALYLPLKAPTRTRGIIAVAPADGVTQAQMVGGKSSRLETLASLVAIAVERIHYVDVAQRTQMQVVAERLRSSILSALSHDVRTPLTALVGLADSLVLSQPPLPEAARESAAAIREQAERLAGLVSKLLDMARLHAGEVALHKEWQPVDEVVGSSIKLLERVLAGHEIRVSLAAGLPLVEFDAVLIERVLCNLLENAAKYSPTGSAIEIGARAGDGMLELSVADAGPGFPLPATADGSSLFDMFVRGARARESGLPGVGLGLAICRAVVEAHAGTIGAENRPAGGARVSFRLPLGMPPSIEEEADSGDVAATTVGASGHD